MLVLTRRAGETMVIDEQISLTVLGVKGEQVRIGVSAPGFVSVHRAEVLERIKEEREVQAPRSDSAQSRQASALSAPVRQEILRDPL